MSNEKSVLVNNQFDEKTTDQNNLFSIKKNFVVLALAFVLVFTSYNGTINLQSSINNDQNLGLYSLALNSAFSILSCLFLTNPLMYLSGYKWTIFISQVIFLLFVASNIYPKQWIIYSISCLCGIFRAALGTAQCSYVSALAKSAAIQKNDDVESTVNKYFAIFFSALQSSQIWGNLITYLFLQTNSNDFIPRNRDSCGASFSEKEHQLTSHSTNRVSKQTISNFYGTFVLLILISLFLVAFLLDQKKHFKALNSVGLIEESFKCVTMTFKQMKRINQLLLLPLPFWVGTSEAFLFGVFTNSFITCSVGVQYVGLVMIGFGITACIFSVIVGFAVKFEHRLKWSLSAFLIWYILLLTMLLWKPIPSQMALLYLIAGFAGIASAIWGPLIPALHGYLFPTDEEAAFSNMVLSQNFGNLIVFFYGGIVRVRTTIIIQMIYLTIALTTYITLEIQDYLNKSQLSKINSNQVK